MPVSPLEGLRAGWTPCSCPGQRVPGATLYARLCVTAPVGAHARWGDQIAIASYLAEATPTTGRSRTSPRHMRTATSRTARPWSRWRVGAAPCGDRLVASTAASRQDLLAGRWDGRTPPCAIVLPALFRPEGRGRLCAVREPAPTREIS
jgi:hypothetical protein